jgi:anaerobic selenocysteine-containing dehydrogenase
MIDLMLRTGPYGDGFGAVPGGLTLDLLLERPHGVDLGPLRPRLPGVLRTPTGAIELCPPELAADGARMATVMEAPPPPFVLVGRRDLRSNNSWMHNLDVLVKGKERCTLLVHPADAGRLGVESGALARVSSRVGTVVVAVQVSDEMRPGVVSLPHGWGHDLDGVALATASRRPGVNSNLLADEELLDPVSGTSVLNGIPVEVVAVDRVPVGVGGQ